MLNGRIDNTRTVHAWGGMRNEKTYAQRHHPFTGTAPLGDATFCFRRGKIGTISPFRPCIGRSRSIEPQPCSREPGRENTNSHPLFLRKHLPWAAPPPAAPPPAALKAVTACGRLSLQQAPAMKAKPLAEALRIQPHLIRPTKSGGLHLRCDRVVSPPIPPLLQTQRAMNARALYPMGSFTRMIIPRANCQSGCRSRPAVTRRSTFCASCATWGECAWQVRALHRFNSCAGPNVRRGSGPAVGHAWTERREGCCDPSFRYICLAR